MELAKAAGVDDPFQIGRVLTDLAHDAAKWEEVSSIRRDIIKNVSDLVRGEKDGNFQGWNVGRDWYIERFKKIRRELGVK